MIGHTFAKLYATVLNNYIFEHLERNKLWARDMHASRNTIKLVTTSLHFKSKPLFKKLDKVFKEFFDSVERELLF